MGAPLSTRIEEIFQGKETFHLGKKFKTIPLACKVTLTVFWDMQGVTLQKFEPHGKNVNAASHCTTLRVHRQAIRRKRPGFLTKGVILLDDNARPHTARVTQELL